MNLYREMKALIKLGVLFCLSAVSDDGFSAVQLWFVFLAPLVQIADNSNQWIDLSVYWIKLFAL